MISGLVYSYELRADFADIARANVEAFFGGPHPAWQLTVGNVTTDVTETGVDRMRPGSAGPVGLPGRRGPALIPGGVLICYVATATQLSRVAEALRADGRFTEPAAWESMVRGWHLEGLAVRPQHRMVGHTGFLITSRRLADGVEPPLRRQAPGQRGRSGRTRRAGQRGTQWSEQDLDERPVSAKKIRKVRRRSAAAIPSRAVSRPTMTNRGLRSRQNVCLSVTIAT